MRGVTALPPLPRAQRVLPIGDPRALAGRATPRAPVQVPLPFAPLRAVTGLDVELDPAPATCSASAASSAVPTPGPSSPSAWPPSLLSVYSPSRAPGAIARAPSKAPARHHAWEGLLAARRACLDGVHELGSRGLDVEQLVEQLRRARSRETMAWAEVRCDALGSTTPTRFSDVNHGDPLGLQVSRPDWQIRDRASRKEIAALERVPGGGYRATVQVEITGPTRGGVMELARLVSEVGR